MNTIELAVALALQTAQLLKLHQISALKYSVH